MPYDEMMRKTISLPESLWRALADYRFENRIPSEAEAVRRLLAEALGKTDQEKPKGRN